MTSLSRPCPCGSGRAYPVCCGRSHTGEALAATAEQLMRARYSAYVEGQVDYTFRTWHPRTRPADVASRASWTGLSIIDVVDGQPGDERGEVEFEARHTAGMLHERSLFLRRAGGWVYVEAL